MVESSPLPLLPIPFSPSSPPSSPSFPSSFPSYSRVPEAFRDLWDHRAGKVKWYETPGPPSCPLSVPPTPHMCLSSVSLDSVGLSWYQDSQTGRV